MILKLAYQENDPVNDPYWNDMRSHDFGKSFPAVRNFIHENSPKMRRSNRRRNHIYWVFAVLLPLLIFFSCKRQTFIEPQGATLGFIAKDSAQSQLEFAIKQYAEKSWKVVFRSHAGTIHATISAPTESYIKLKALSEHLKSIAGVAETYLSAVSTTVKESPLSRLTYKIFHQHMDATSASQEQLRDAIERKLKDKGLDSLIVQLIEENKTIQLKLVPTGNHRDFSIDLTLDDGSSFSARSEKWE